MSFCISKTISRVTTLLFKRFQSHRLIPARFLSTLAWVGTAGIASQLLTNTNAQSISVSNTGSLSLYGGFTSSYGTYGYFQDDFYDLYRFLDSYKYDRMKHVAKGDPDWLHWWEIYREHYLPTAPQTQVDSYKTVTNNPIPAILAGLDSDQPTLRWASAITAGRLGLAQATPQLIQLTQDTDPNTCIAAWIALGLIGTDSSLHHLLEPAIEIKKDQANQNDVQERAPLNDFQEIGRCYALGMLPLQKDKIPQSHEESRYDLQQVRQEVESLLITRIGGPYPDAVKRSAMWALKHIQGDQALHAAESSMWHNKAYGIADEAVDTIGLEQEQIYPPIFKTLTQRLGRMDRIPLYEQYLTGEDDSSYLNQSQSPLSRWESFGYVNAIRTRVILNLLDNTTALRQIESKQRQDPASAELLIPLRNDLWDAILKETYMQYDGRHWFYRPLPLLAIGAIGDTRDSQKLANAYNGDLYIQPGLDVQPFLITDSRFRFNLQKRDRARTYAAIAIGLYLREPTLKPTTIKDSQKPVYPPPTNTDRIHPAWIENYYKMMQAVINNAYEDTGFRCASAIAIGLSGNPQALNRLKNSIQKIKHRDENKQYGPQLIDPLNPPVSIHNATRIVTAHALLGMTLLERDEQTNTWILQQIENEFNRLLNPTYRYANLHNMDTLLAWRALVQATSRIDDAKAGDLLQHAWGRHQFVNDAVVTAYAQRGDFRLLSTLIKLTQQPNSTRNSKQSPLQQTVMPNASQAMQLIGILFDPPHTGPLWHTVERLNHTLPLLAVPAAATTESNLAEIPIGTIERMVAPAYFDLLRGGTAHRRFTYR